MNLVRLQPKGGGSGELHGAELIVLTTETSLAGKSVLLYKNNDSSPVQTTTFSTVASSGEYSARFVIQENGTYKIEANDGTKTASKENISITSDQIINKISITEELTFVKIVTFSDGTDDEIADMIKAHYDGIIDISDYWAIGDTRKIHLNSVTAPYSGTWSEQDITIVITDMETYDLETPLGVRSKNAITIQTRELVNNVTAQNSSLGTSPQVTYVGYSSDSRLSKWGTVPMRTWISETWKNNALPSSLTSIIKSVKRKALTSYNVKTTEDIIDTVFFPSYTEVFGNIAYTNYADGTTPNNWEGRKWEYFESASNIIKQGNNNGVPNGTNVNYWLGSPSKDYHSAGKYGWLRTAGSTTVGTQYNDSQLPIAPAFCI